MCITAGNHSGRLEIKNFRGTSTSPITFINSGGKVRIDAQQDWVGGYLKNNEHIRFTGTGDPVVAYGFEIYNSTNKGISASAKTRYVEIDHIEIHDVGGAGIGAGTSAADIVDTDGDGSVRDEWRQYDTYIHHNWLHDIATEGFYVGGSFWQNGVEPELEGVELSHNTIERTGWDGLQVGSAVKNVKVHHNTIVDAGLSDNPHSGNGRFGMIVNRGTTGDFYNNKIYNSRSAGVYIQGIGDYRFFNNLIVNSGMAKTYDGIAWMVGNTGYFYNNTIVKAAGNGIRCSSGISRGSIFDNIITETATPQVNGCNVTQVNNLVYGSTASAGFADPANSDFHLLADSPAVDKGSASGFAPYDLDDVIRPQGAKADIGAYEFAAQSQIVLLKSLISSYGQTGNLDRNSDGTVNFLDVNL